MQVIPSSNGLVLVEREVPDPSPDAGQVLVRVHAAGVTPSELLWYPTTHTADGQARVSAIPGHEFSGVVAGLGTGVEEFSVGEEVFGMNDWFADGATAEYCLARPVDLVRKPSSLSHQLAATVPIGALTAWQGLFDRARLQAGDRVLVHGGSGAVGLFAVQLAHGHGASVVATASAGNLEFVRGLGADTALDYRETHIEQTAGGFDIVFDTVGGETLARSWQLLRPGGRVVTIAADSESSSDPRVKEAFFIVEMNRTQLEGMAMGLAEGRLKAFVKSAVKFDFAKAYAPDSARRSGYGKVVIAIV